MEGVQLHLRYRVLFTLGCCAVLAACAGRNVVPNGSGSFDAAPSGVAAAPTATPRGLYTDAQLRTTADPNAKAEPKAYEAWTAANAVPIRSETDDQDFSDLAPFGAAVGNRRIVGLGESSHGVGDYSLMKTRLIKYLHEQKGFDVIAFEYDMFDDYIVNKTLATATPEQSMWNGCFGVWWSSEALELFSYIQQQAKTKHPLILAGMDVQEYAMTDQRAAAMQAAIAPVDATMAANVASYDPTYVNLINKAADTGDATALAAQMPALKTFYANLDEWMSAHMNAMVAHSADKNMPRLLQTVARYTPNYALEVDQLDHTKYDLGAAGNAPRDAGMAGDVDFLARTLYPTQKIMIWAHNYHLQRQNVYTNTGSLIEKDFGTAYYATGLLPYRGQGAYNGGQIYNEPTAPAQSIDGNMYYARWRWSFLDFSSLTKNAGDAWAFKNQHWDYFGFYSLPAFVPKDAWDGIVYVDEIHPPHYLFPTNGQTKKSKRLPL
jgi:erythromycin esterase